MHSIYHSITISKVLYYIVYMFILLYITMLPYYYINLLLTYNIPMLCTTKYRVFLLVYQILCIQKKLDITYLLMYISYMMYTLNSMLFTIYLVIQSDLFGMVK